MTPNYFDFVYSGLIGNAEITVADLSFIVTELEFLEIASKGRRQQSLRAIIRKLKDAVKCTPTAQ